jgi:UPF0042 nucleotide-binding protein
MATRATWSYCLTSALAESALRARVEAFVGSRQRVVKYLRSHDEVKETLKRFTDLLSYLLPLYKREGKVVRDGGIGCTGGRHRR